MQLELLDALAFLAFLAAVIGISIRASRKEESGEDYFLAGRNLGWWLIGFSLIASNISTEHFVGQAGQGFGSVGLAVASYEWIAALSLLVVAFLLLPLYLRLGLYTMPELLERRFGVAPRSIMAVYMMLAYVGVAVAAVLYSGALGLSTIFGLDLVHGIWAIGLLAGAYTIYGGLKAVVWSDLLQGSALLVGGLVVALLALSEAGGWQSFLEQSGDKLHLALPADHPEIPWTALILGIWIPNFFYWGCNQFITQRTLAARSLRQGQLGIVLAAWIKLAIPFLVIVPGILAFQLYANEIEDGDQAYAVLVQKVLPGGLRGIFFAALFGAVMSSLDSMLNSASTIFTMDIYRRHIRRDASPRRLLRVGRITTAVLVVIGCLIAPLPARFEGVFNYIQMIWGFVSPGIVVVFAFALFVRRASSAAAVVGLTANVPIYALLLWLRPETAYLNHMAVTALILAVLMALVTLVRPRPVPFAFEASGSGFDLRPSPLAKWLGAGAALMTVALYVLFW